MSDPKELNFFDRQDPTPDALASYTEHFAGAGADQRAGEATPTYLHSDVAPARMARTVPDARLVAILRNPVERAYSHYWWRRLWRAETREFADAIADELAGSAPSGAEYLGHGTYHPHLVRLGEHYPRSSVLVLLFDDLPADAGKVFESLCKHIGADPSVRPPVVGARINTTHDVRWLKLWLAMERWRGRPGRRYALARFVDARNSFQFVPPPLDRATATRLAEHFAEPNAALAAFLGRDLSAWSAPPS